MIIDGKKLCCKCNRLLPVEEFNAHNRMKDGLQSYCRSCQKKMVKRCRRGEDAYGMEVNFHLAESGFRDMRVEVYLPEQKIRAECNVKSPKFWYGRLTQATRQKILYAIRQELKKQMKKPPTKKHINNYVKFY